LRIRHREAAKAAAAIHGGIGDFALDCFASLAMTELGQMAHGRRVHERSVKPVGGPAMLNASMVNGRESRFPPPLFRESFPISGRIPRFQNPFKYNRNREINRKTAHPASRLARHCALFLIVFRDLLCP
jgi:hypothetical protein